MLPVCHLLIGFLLALDGFVHLELEELLRLGKGVKDEDGRDLPLPPPPHEIPAHRGRQESKAQEVDGNLQVVSPGVAKWERVHRAAHVTTPERWDWDRA